MKLALTQYHYGFLVLHAICLLPPLEHNCTRLLTEELNLRNIGVLELKIHSSKEFSIIESYFGSIVFRCSIEDFVNACPHGGCQAHRAWFTRGVEIASRQ